MGLRHLSCRLGYHSGTKVLMSILSATGRQASIHFGRDGLADNSLVGDICGTSDIYLNSGAVSSILTKPEDRLTMVFGCPSLNLLLMTHLIVRCKELVLKLT